MCTYMSFYVGWRGEIYAGDLRSHSSAKEAHNLSDALKSTRPPVPVEWVKNDGNSINVRVPDNIGRDASWYISTILSISETRGDMLAYLFRQTTHWPCSLYLRDCDLSTIDRLPDTVGGSLYLNGCDLSTIDRLPDTVGGYLYLRDCDLSTITNIEKHKSKIIR